MDRCNELCTKEATGYCALCAALADRERFIAWWMKGGVLRAGMRAMQPSRSRAVEAHKAVMWRAIAALWHQGQWAVLDEVMAPTVVSHTSHTGEDGGRAVHGLDGAREVVAAWRRAFPDLQVTLDDCMVEGDTVVARWTSWLLSVVTISSVESAGNSSMSASHGPKAPVDGKFLPGVH